MLRILGSPKKLCDGLTRRDLLRIGTLGLSGFGLSELLRSEGQAGPAPDRPSGRAKHCILLYLFGAASQLETFDVKQDAPNEVRGLAFKSKSAAKLIYTLG